MLGRVVLGMVLSGATASAACAATFTDVTFWVGSGSNQAALVIDWHDGTTPEALLWGYRWDGNKTGKDMVQAIDAADPRLSVEVDTTSFMKGISYDSGNGLVHNQINAADWSQVWSYWVSDGTANPAWIAPWDYGFSDRTLANGSWDAWSFTSWDTNYNPINSPGNPVAAVPEPAIASIMLIGGGFFALARRQRSK